jgi:hypothetical protein
MIQLATGGGTVVEHLTRHTKVRGSSPATATDTETEKMAKTK